MKAKGIRVGRVKVDLRKWSFGAETEDLLNKITPALKNRVLADIAATIDSELRGANDSGVPADGYLNFIRLKSHPSAHLILELPLSSSGNFTLECNLGVLVEELIEIGGPDEFRTAAKFFERQIKLLNAAVAKSQKESQ